jgi:hypothetical protein
MVRDRIRRLRQARMRPTDEGETGVILYTQDREHLGTGAGEDGVARADRGCEGDGAGVGLVPVKNSIHLSCLNLPRHLRR